MATNQNNIHINSFSKGMNTDTSFDMVGNEQYVFGQNIRITANALLKGVLDSNNKEGVVTPVPSGQDHHGSFGELDDNNESKFVSILAISTLGDIGAIIVKDRDDFWHVFRVDRKDDQLTFNPIFKSSQPTEKNKFSTVINKELDKVVKLYIADGVHSIMAMNIDNGDLFDEDGNVKPYYYGGSPNSKQLTEDDFANDKYFPKKQVVITEKISGTLHTGQVQYTYRFYDKYGVCSKLAPLTNKIQVIDASRQKEIGNAEDTQTTIGFQLSISVPQEVANVFDHLQIYRLHYAKPNTDANVSLIYDSKLLPGSDTNVKINDSGLDSVQDLSLQEFAALDSMDIVPQCIEQNQNYLFAADIADNTRVRVENDEFEARAFQYDSTGDERQIVLYKNLDTAYRQGSKSFASPEDVLLDNDRRTLNEYVDMTRDFTGDSPCMYDEEGYLGGTGKNVSWRFITTYVPLDSSEAKDNDTPPSGDGGVWVPEVYYLTKTNRGIEMRSAGMDVENVYMVHNILAKHENASPSYNDIFTSSLFRSLRRDEVYRYGIVLYDNHGNRSDVQWIADIRTPSEKEFSATKIWNDRLLCAMPIGIEFNVHDIDRTKFSAYQIVRCAKTAAYSKNLMQCVVARPTRQAVPNQTNANENTLTKSMSPYYPMPFLTSEYILTRPYYSSPAGDDHKLFTACNISNKELFQIFSPEIQFVQDDSLSKLQSFVTKFSPVSYVYGKSIEQISDMISYQGYDSLHEHSYKDVYFNGSPYIEGYYRGYEWDQYEGLQFVRPYAKGASQVGDDTLIGTPYDKTQLSFIQKLYNKTNPNDESVREIKSVKNVSNPTWEQGFGNINGAGGQIVSGVKQYKSYSTSINQYEYVNWICNGMYDLRISHYLSATGYDDDNGLAVMIMPGDNKRREPEAAGWIGPGPRCFLAVINNKSTGSITGDQVEKYLTHRSRLYPDTPLDVIDQLGTSVINITHVPLQYAGLTDEEKQYDVYYGFGNIKVLESDIENKYPMFDGDVYITPCEITSMYKAYDFNSFDTLPSAQFIYYVPLESPINTFFDYGMGYKNTQSKTVQLEPGEISGVTSQDRPEHQYNMIYSDNNISNDIYNVQSIEYTDQKFPQRIHYSQLKTNGELIDNWQMFKPLDYIDADTRYGDITNLLTNKDIIYFWQKQAFGKLSVNERSLVTDNNSNTVQLGQGGVLQRTDYINTRYGMRKEDFSAISAEGVVYWIDILNKAIVMSNGQSVINLGEQTNVQSYINYKMTEDIPTIHYDLQNNELLCKCLDGDQMVFNIKLNVATSVYKREYEDMIMFNNVLYGIYASTDENGKPRSVLKYNYLQDEEDSEIQYNEPTELQFIVGPSASITKVFDDQEIVTLSRGNNPADYMDGKLFSFTTNIIDEVQKNPDGYTDREGNIRYAIPRYTEHNYGSRMRGKWMKVDIEDTKPKYEHSISHILTKFRQSFS